MLPGRRALLLLLFALVARAGADDWAPAKKPGKNALIAGAEASLARVEASMMRAGANAAKGAAAIAKHQQSAEAKFAAMKAKVFTYMKADAAINGIPISKLQPSQYGLGEDPALTMEDSELTKRRAVYQRMAKAATAVAALIRKIAIAPMAGGRRLGGAAGGAAAGGAAAEAALPGQLVEQLRALGEQLALDEQLAAGAAGAAGGVHAAGLPAALDPETKLALLKKQASSATTEASVDEKIVSYLEKEEHREAALQNAYKSEEQAALTKEEAATGGVGATPVMAALVELSHAQTTCGRLFTPLLARAKELSAAAEGAIGAIAGQGVLGASAPAAAFHFAQLKALFVSADAALRKVAPLFTRLGHQHDAILAALKDERAKLEAMARTAEARKLQLALGSPDFMVETNEYKREAKLANLALALAKKVDEVARHPGQGWLSVGGGGGGAGAARLLAEIGEAIGAGEEGAAEGEGAEAEVEAGGPLGRRLLGGAEAAEAEAGAAQVFGVGFASGLAAVSLVALTSSLAGRMTSRGGAL
jgi:hypothetical protein